MKINSIIGKIIVIILLILAFFAGRETRYWRINRWLFLPKKEILREVKEGKVEEVEEPKYESVTRPEDCKLCGGKEGYLVPMYKGQDNLGIISLNTFHVANITINRYDDYGRLLKEPESGFGTNIVNTGEDGFMSMVSANTNRGYASADISMNKDKVLDMEKVLDNLCTKCLNRALEEDWREPYGIGLINFKTGEIRLFDERIRGFMLGDFYVLCEPRTEGDEVQ